MSVSKLQKKLKEKKIILMDGGMGSEILNHGQATTLPLWSAEVLLTKPDIVKEIHKDYIEAGAEIIITNTFSTTRRVFSKKGIGDKAEAATVLACQLAREAVEESKPEHDIFIAGSASPLEDCYSPELTPPQKECDEEHLEIARNLKKGGVDFILAETMITLRETISCLEAAKKVGLPVAVSFCCNINLELLSGEPLKEVIPVIEKYNPLFVGVNCINTHIATKAINYLSKITKLPLSVYAQGTGHADSKQGWSFSDKDNEILYINECRNWLKEGAQIIGGCCGTTPNYIERIKSLLHYSK